MAAGAPSSELSAGDSTSCSIIKPVSSAMPSLCQECQQESFRYQCPRCSLRTCSLQCCVAHKERTGCTGKRDRTKFLPKAHMDDGTLASDYHFLEDVLGAMERAKRTVGKPNDNTGQNKRFKPNGDGKTTKDTTPHSMLLQIENLKVGSNSNTVSNVSQETSAAAPASNNTGGEAISASAENTPQMIAAAINNMTNSTPVGLPANCWKQLGPKWKHFWQQAKLRGTDLLLMPSGMQRRKANSSHIKKDIIHWTVDIRIHPTIPSLPPTVQSRKISEQSNLWDELKKVDLADVLLSKPTTDAMATDDNDSKNATAIPTVHWLLQKLPSPSNRPCYIELSYDKDATLQSILKGMTLIEYPTIEVVPSSRLSEFPKVIEEVVHGNVDDGIVEAKV